MNRHNIRLAEELLFWDICGPTRGLDFRGSPPDVMVEHLHFETSGAACHDLADPTQTDNSQRGMMHIQAEELLESPFVPRSLPDIGFGLVQPAGGGEDQRPGKIGGGVVQDAGGVGGHDAVGAAGGQIDIVVTHGDVADRLQSGTTVQEILIDPFGKGGHGPVLVGENSRQLFGGQDLVLLIGLNIEMGRQKIQDILKNLTGNKNLFFHLSLPLLVVLKRKVRWTNLLVDSLYQLFPRIENKKTGGFLPFSIDKYRRRVVAFPIAKRSM